MCALMTKHFCNLQCLHMMPIASIMNMNIDMIRLSKGSDAQLVNH